ncbi:flocculation protein FLO11 [Drosophila ficusphila]|uniref:flocculation protein FLO11 n=1 Tax=Drosophila ficusphila TaxID=30025 RepID=UPI0007E7A6B0|nr:flocculation protein FLO11 [Drosophila ficusphila]
MGWWSKKSETDRCQPSQALALQDPRTRVKTTSAATETTNTAVQNSTITDSNKQTVTFLSTRQTVTHTQRAFITETTTRRTPSQAELEALFAQMRMGGEGATGTTTTTTTTTSRSRPPSLNGVSFRSTQPFKATASNAGKRSSTLVKTEQTTVTKKNGQKVTQHLETHRVDLKGMGSKPAWSPFASSANSSASSYVSPYAQKPSLAITYTSPYAKGPGTASSSASSVKSLSSASTPKPSPPSSSFTSFFKPAPKPADKPLTSTAAPRPYISLSSSATKPKATATAPSTRTLDAQGNSAASLGTSKSSLSKIKLKPARVYIFNHERFDSKNEFRTGSAQDVKVLRATFEQLKCKVEVINDATLNTIKRTVEMLERKDFQDKSALVLVILTHGTRHDRLAARDDDYSLDYDVLFPLLRNRTLKDKPKLLFVQACKGANELGGFMTDAAQPNGSPNEILKCYSTYEGYVSYRTEDGTPFIQTLCEALNRSGKTSDIDTIMTNVRRVVKSQTKDGQIPSVTSTLTSKYVFGDYI